MANKIGSIPDFTDEDSPSNSEFGTEVSVSSTEKAAQPEAAEEKEVTPSEPPAESKPNDEQEAPVEDIGELNLQKEELARTIEGLKKERRRLILERDELRADGRGSIQTKIDQVQDKIDDLKDVNPEDVNTIDRILKAKGYVSKESVDQMFYNSRKQEEIARFLNEFREYNEENDPDGKKFGPLLQEVKLYKEPQDPSMYGVLLRRAHKMLSGTTVSSGRDVTIKQRQAQIAGVGSGGTQRSSSVKTFSDQKRQWLRDGGWSEEDIKGMEQRQQL